LASHWTLGPEEEKIIRIRPRLTVNSVDAALDAAISGLGIARLFSYQVEEAVARGRLIRLLRDFEPPAAPIHLVRPAGRHLPRKTALFIEQAAAALRGKFGAGGSGVGGRAAARHHSNGAFPEHGRSRPQKA
jgi:DNA-binding transcriptional LysR family regulator